MNVKTFFLTLDEVLHMQAKRAAFDKGLSMRAFIRQAIIAELARLALKKRGEHGPL